MNQSLAIGVIIVIILIAAGAYVALSAPKAAAAGNAMVTYTLSDAAPTMGTVSSVNMQVQSIQMHSKTTGQWYSIPVKASGSYNLTAYTTTYAFIGNTTVPAGNYDEIMVDTGSVTATVNGTQQAVVMPSTSLKIFGNFTMSGTPNTTATNWVNIDFKANQSLHTTGSGKIIMLPVVQVIAWSDAKLGAGSNGAVSVQNYGTTTATVNAGMNVNGTMEANLVVPQGTNLTIGSNGGIGIGVG
jgi:hypothetical protein